MKTGTFPACSTGHTHTFPGTHTQKIKRSPLAEARSGQCHGWSDRVAPNTRTSPHTHIRATVSVTSASWFSSAEQQWGHNLWSWHCLDTHCLDRNTHTHTTEQAHSISRACSSRLFVLYLGLLVSFSSDLRPHSLQRIKLLNNAFLWNLLMSWSTYQLPGRATRRVKSQVVSAPPST